MAEQEVVDARTDKTDEEVFLEEAHKRFKAAEDYEAQNRADAEDDLDCLSGKQWPQKVLDDRDRDGRPALTINRLPQFLDQVIGDARLNRMSIKVRPTTLHEVDEENEAEEVAEILNGLIRNIENVSDGPVVYQAALEGAAGHGFGYFRAVTEYSDDDVFELDIRLRTVRNAFTIYFDPQHESLDGRDAKWVFVSQIIPIPEFKELYPKAKEPSSWEGTTDHTTYWIHEENVRIAEYWVKRPFERRIVLLDDGEVVDGAIWARVQADYAAAREPEEPRKPLRTVVRERTVKSHVVVQYIIDGAQIIDGPRADNGKIILNFKDDNDIRTADGRYRDYVWPGKFIPIIPVWGKEIVIGDRRVLRSLIRDAKDPQRMYNYERTAETERVALAKIPPVVFTPEQVEGHEGLWTSTANEPYRLLNYVPMHPPPMFPTPPQASSGNIALSSIAADEMKATTGLFDPSLGARSNETSGRAIIARQREGDVANFRFHDNLRRAVKYAGDILVDLIPKIYDTDRQIMVLDEKGDQSFVGINQTVNGKIVNNLALGKYSVTVTAGPSYTTQRIEAAEALSSLAGSIRDPLASKILVAQIIGNMDFPGARDTAKAIERTLPPELFAKEGEEPPPKGPNAEQVMQGAELQTEMRKAEKLETEIELNRQKLQEGQEETRRRMEAVAEGAQNRTLQKLGPFLQAIGAAR